MRVGRENALYVKGSHVWFNQQVNACPVTDKLSLSRKLELVSAHWVLLSMRNTISKCLKVSTLQAGWRNYWLLIYAERRNGKMALTRETPLNHLPTQTNLFCTIQQQLLLSVLWDHEIEKKRYPTPLSLPLSIATWYCKQTGSLKSTTTMLFPEISLLQSLANTYKHVI